MHIFCFSSNNIFGDGMNYTKLNMNEKEYSDYVDSKSKRSPIVKDCFLAFLVGGIICCLGEFFKNIFLLYNIEEKVAGTYATLLLILIAAVLTALKLYAKIGKYAGAGSIVPITGFSNSVVSPAIEFKTEGMILRYRS